MDLSQIARTPLFRDLPQTELEPLLRALEARTRRFSKGETILHAGEPVTALGLVLSGSVLVSRDDFLGNTAVLDRIGAGQVFAETYACLPGEPLMVRVAAAEPAEVLFLRTDRLLSTGAVSGGPQGILLGNLLALSARKNLALSRKIFHTAPKTIRGRLLSYLSEQAVRAGSRSFSIPFDRQQLADYLGVERSALSHELGKMRREGLLRFRKNVFQLEPGCREEG